jgi:hypothetical protein
LTDTAIAAAQVRQGRKFGAVLGTAFGVFAGLFWWREHPTVATAMGGIAAMLLIGALVAPRQLLPVERAWMRFAHAISRVTTPIFMGIIYFVVISPIGLIARLVGHRPLVRPRGQSAWIPREAGRRKSDLHHQF